MNKRFSNGKRINPVVVCIILGASVAAIAFISLFAGRYPLSPGTVWNVLMGGGTDLEQNVVLNIRMPRMLLALLVGAGLATSGAAFQGTFRNPMVSPDVLSVSSGASFGAVLGIMLSGYTYGVITTFALIFGILSVFLTYWFSRIKGKTTTLSLILSGMVMSAFFNALVSLAKYTADADTQLPAITYWLLGSFASTTYKNVLTVVFPVLIGISVLIAMSHKINILSLGDEEAYTLGVNPTRTRIIIIFAATLVTAACIAVTGIIGWVGLIIPHIVRMMVGPNHKWLIVASSILGASFMAFMDLLARTILASEIPVGVLTALIGAPFFIVLFKRTKEVRG